MATASGLSGKSPCPARTRDSLTTFTGVSGSGKSSLAYHTIYQEG